VLPASVDPSPADQTDVNTEMLETVLTVGSVDTGDETDSNVATGGVEKEMVPSDAIAVLTGSLTYNSSSPAFDEVSVDDCTNASCV